MLFILFRGFWAGFVAETWSLGQLGMTPLVSPTASISFTVDTLCDAHISLCCFSNKHCGLQKMSQYVSPQQRVFRGGKWEEMLTPSTGCSGGRGRKSARKKHYKGAEWRRCGARWETSLAGGQNVGEEEWDPTGFQQIWLTQRSGPLTSTVFAQ